MSPLLGLPLFLLTRTVNTKVITRASPRSHSRSPQKRALASRGAAEKGAASLHPLRHLLHLAASARHLLMSPHAASPGALKAAPGSAVHACGNAYGLVGLVTAAARPGHVRILFLALLSHLLLYFPLTSSDFASPAPVRQEPSSQHAECLETAARASRWMRKYDGRHGACE